MEAITIHPKDKEQSTALKYLLKQMNIPFKESEAEGKYYNSEFEKKMEKAAEDKKAGRFESIKTEDLWK